MEKIGGADYHHIYRDAIHVSVTFNIVVFSLMMLKIIPG